MMKIIKNNLLIAILLLSIGLYSQENELYEGVIINGKSKGFKSIALTPSLRSIANHDLSDVRILDSKNQQVPYFLKENNFEIIEKFIPIDNEISFRKKTTTIVIPNRKKKLYDSFTFQVSNADIHKTCTIEGSIHKKRWFVVSEKIHLSLDNNTDQAFNYYTIKFPAIDYEYLKIVINDSTSSPINIKKVGYFSRQKSTNKVLNGVGRSVLYSTTQKNKKTLIHVEISKGSEINQIHFDIDSQYYNRKANLYTLKTVKKKKIKKNFLQLTLNSDSKPIFKNLSFRENDFWIAIDNKDNRPLKDIKVKLFQKTKFLIADLKPNERYTISAGDKKLKKPSYDLVSFKNTIDRNLPVLNLSNENFIFSKKPVRTKKEFYEQVWFMWVSIGLIALIILLFTMSLLKQVNNK